MGKTEPPERNDGYEGKGTDVVDDFARFLVKPYLDVTAEERRRHGRKLAGAGSRCRPAGGAGATGRGVRRAAEKRPRPGHGRRAEELAGHAAVPVVVPRGRLQPVLPGLRPVRREDVQVLKKPGTKCMLRYQR